jgi:hypothetical protein
MRTGSVCSLQRKKRVGGRGCGAEGASAVGELLILGGDCGSGGGGVDRGAAGRAALALAKVHQDGAQDPATAQGLHLRCTLSLSLALHLWANVPPTARRASRDAAVN